jgi:organic radical activating enzyme
VRIHSILHGSRANGPGLRSVVWFQGCSLGCPGCQNPKTHRFDGGYEIDPTELGAQIVREAAERTTGLTISGGEPLQQAFSLYEMICMVNALRPNWDIGLFTGYTLTELTCGEYQAFEAIPPQGTFYRQVGIQTNQEAKRLLWEHQIKDRLTWAVTGRYDRNRPTLDVDLNLRPWLRMCSSSNQILWLFRGGKFRYQDFGPMVMEISIGDDGFTKISGFPAIKSQTGA